MCAARVGMVAGREGSDVRVPTAQRGRGHFSAATQGHGNLARAR